MSSLQTMVLSAKKDQLIMITTPLKTIVVKVLDDDYKFKNNSEIRFIGIDEANGIPKDVWDSINHAV